MKQPPAHNSSSDGTNSGSDTAISTSWTLRWSSELVQHTDITFIDGINARQVSQLPVDLTEPLQDVALGESVSWTLGEREGINPWQASLQKIVPYRAFNPHSSISIQPRRGRFYPQIVLASHDPAYNGSTKPFRIIEHLDDALHIDLNHPLAPYEVNLQVTLHEVIHEHTAQRGMQREPLNEVIGGGAGLQARWRGEPTEFFTTTPLDRQDKGDDALFYRKPPLLGRLIGEPASLLLSRYYAELIPAGSRLLDLMSGSRSHLEQIGDLDEVVGVGLNEKELAENPALSAWRLYDLNRATPLPYPPNSFDYCLCSLSVEYLTDPIYTFRDVARILKPGGRFIVSFSNRWNPPKAITLWPELLEFERMGLVLEYFHRSGAYSDLQTISHRSRQQSRNGQNSIDPLYIVVGRASESC